MLHCILVSFVIYFVVQSISVPNFYSSHILSLNGDTYDDSKEKILLTLGCMDLDLTLCVDKPLVPTESSTQTEKASYERWGDLITKFDVYQV